MKKFNFIFDKSKKANNLKKIISKKYKNYPIKNSKVIIVGGGDGFMLKTIKKLYKYKKPFYVVNCGSVGFLLNKFTSQRIIERINKAKSTVIYPLQIKAISKAKKINSLLAINELSIKKLRILIKAKN